VVSTWLRATDGRLNGLGGLHVDDCFGVVAADAVRGRIVARGGAGSKERAIVWTYRNAPSTTFSLGAVRLSQFNPSFVIRPGDRRRSCNALVERIVLRLLKRYGRDILIVNGGAPGVEWAFLQACRELGVNVEVHTADWRTLGNIAGPARNREMVQAGADLCMAFHRTLETSKGTKDCVRQSLAAGIPAYLIADERGLPVRLLADDARLK
jgi:hypothetical protein